MTAPSPLASLTAWATQTHLSSPSGATTSQLTKRARTIYDNWAPQPTLAQMDTTRQRAYIANLETMHRAPDMPFAIAPQSQDARKARARSSPAEYLQQRPDKAMSEFAYRYRPSPSRANEASGASSRLTVNMNPYQAQAVTTALGGLLKDETANPGLRALKVMGPANVGQRVDDAVLYMRGHNAQAAARTARNLQGALAQTPAALVGHVPPGMEQIVPGVSYAETRPGDSTSHGSARKKIVAAAVEDYRTLGGGMSHHVSYRAFRAGYNPNVPSRALEPQRPQLMQQIRDIGSTINRGGTLAQTLARGQAADVLAQGGEPSGRLKTRLFRAGLNPSAPTEPIGGVRRSALMQQIQSVGGAVSGGKTIAQASEPMQQLRQQITARRPFANY